jgi:chaperonin cofactor prefoldin
MMQEIDTLQDEVSKIKKTLAELKVKLYAKFGSAINLDE